ncbi:MAG: DNA replication/repair protein RecF [Sphingomonadaceae bacterium]|nr:DNA replication/repair protein RecF [Sphingomonadaceae bacterium]
MAHLTRLTLTDFRSYAAAEVAVGPGAIVVTGDNGQGKTNLLDAVSLLSPGRGLRGVALSDAARSGGPGGWTVAAEIAAEGGAVAIGTGTTPAAPDRRVVRVNGAAAPIAALGEWLSVLWLTPAMDRLFVDTASARRRFLDRLVLALDLAHGGEVTRYDAAMRARTRLLTGEVAADPAWLASLERAMAEHGERVAAARAATVAALAEAVAATPDSDFPRAALALAGGEAEDLAARLAATRTIDASVGRATAGPHRVDLIVTHAAKGQPAARSSTGEQKALLLGLVLAHAGLVEERTGRPPVLLLDEVAAHLDPRRRAALFDRLAGRGQVWLTGTEAALFAGLDGQRLHVADGRVA